MLSFSVIVFFAASVFLMGAYIGAYLCLASVGAEARRGRIRIAGRVHRLIEEQESADAGLALRARQNG